MTVEQAQPTPPKVQTLRNLITVALRVLPPQQTTAHVVLQALLQKELQQEAVLDIPFAKFVLDNRQLTPANAAHRGTLAAVENNDIEADASVAINHPKEVFVLLKSHTQPIDTSANYVQMAAKHAAFILSEIDDELITAMARPNCPIVSVVDIRSVLGTLLQLSLLTSAERQSLHSLADLVQLFPKVVAITGTNGKTTTSQLVAQLCQLSGRDGLINSAVMGTAGNGRLNHLRQSSHTTGDALAVQTFLQTMLEEGVDVLALEASSHGLHQQRLQGVPVQVAVYTNLSRDHLDYHPDMQEYAAAKAKLFDTAHFPTLTHAIINIDDEFAPLMLQTAAASGLQIWTYSLDANKTATFTAAQLNPSLNGVEIELVTHFGTVWLNSPLLGRFNVANLLAAIGAAMALGIELADIPNLVTKLQGADGRMQRVMPKGLPQSMSTPATACFIVDYAHTPDALTQVLSSLKPHCQGQLWAVFGCGGDRDSGKRPLMAQAGLALADKVILTADNPRSESPEAILADMQQGMTADQLAKTTVIGDRREAIQQAVKRAGVQDIVVIAGKGHETYQEINGVRHDFDDRQVLQAAFLLR